jgi:hypothetical protein
MYANSLWDIANNRNTQANLKMIDAISMSFFKQKRGFKYESRHFQGDEELKG